MNKINMTNETKLYKVLKVKMKDFEEEEKEIIDGKTGNPKTEVIATGVIKIITKDVKFTNKNNEKDIFQATEIRRKNIRQYHTLIKENDVIRIIRALNLKNNNSLDDNYIFIKDIITVEAKVNTYLSETKEFITLSYQQIDKDKNIKLDSEGNEMIENITYKRLMASSGGIRNKKVTFIHEDLWSKANDILLCGLPSDMKYAQLSKFNAYYALPSTDSTPVTMPNIAVIDDYEKPITETFDVVRQARDENGNIIKDEYTCKPEENYTEIIKPFDGAGIVDISLAKVWATELGLYKEEAIKNEDGTETVIKSGYIPSYFQFRCIPGIKGNLYVMDIKRYAIEYKIRNQKENKKAIVKDAFNNNIEVMDSEGKLLINAILTKSQFKFYSKWKELYGEEGLVKWKEFFNTEVHGYKRTFNISKYAVDCNDIKREVLLSYQPLQTLHFDDKQIKSLCSTTVERIKLISSNVDEFLKFRGIVVESEEQENKNRNNTLIPSYYKALETNRSLWYDEFIQSKVREDIKGFKERSYKGAIIAEGNYQVAIPDIVGLIQYAFGEEVIGCLKANEVYSKYWLNYQVKNDKDEWIESPKDKIDIIRFPHIAQEHRVVNVVQPEFIKGQNWLKYINEGIVTSMYDSNALALNSMDYDGDKIMTTYSKEIIEQAEKEKVNTIIYAPEPKESNSNEDKEVLAINNMNKIIETDVMGMGNDIGSVVNKISQLWSIVPKDEDEKQRISEMIKIMSIIGSLTIDFVKTGIKSPIPKTILNYLEKENVKKPDFMKWKYSNDAKKERAINRNKELLEKEKVELFGQTKCTVNEISWHMQKEIDDIELEIDKNNCFELSKFIKNENFNQRAVGYEATLKTMIELKKEEDKIGYLQNKGSDEFLDSEDNKEQYAIFYRYAKNKLMDLVYNKSYKLDKEKMLDYIIYIVCNHKEFIEYNNFNLLWNTWGNELTRRMNDKDNKTKELGEEAIVEKESRTKKLKTKVDKKKEFKEKVSIEMFRGDKEIEISDAEINEIKKLNKIENRRLALTMLILDKFCKVYERDFNIANNKNSIKMYNIYKLSNLNHKSIAKYLREIKNDSIIELDEAKNGTILTCKVNIEGDGKPVKTIKDVNEIKDLFGFIA